MKRAGDGEDLVNGCEDTPVDEKLETADIRLFIFMLHINNGCIEVSDFMVRVWREVYT